MITMKSFIIACLLFVGTLSVGFKLEPKIVGGYQTRIEHFPYQVYLEVQSLFGGWQCGASILDKNTLLTAAHCVTPPSFSVIISAYARAGSTDKKQGGQNIRIASAHRHPLFDADNISDDIAVLKLQTSLNFNTRVKPIPLGERIPQTGAMLSVAGWGTRSEWSFGAARFLYATKVPMVDKQQCLKIYKDFEIPVSKNTFCAGYLNPIDQDTCQGDSGGAITYNGQQIGIVSWGDGCGKTGKLGVYTDVTKYKSFIRKHMN